MYDQVIEEYFGIIEGSSEMVFIKTGKGGTIYGYQNKYLNLAKMIHQQYGYSVVVAANPEKNDCDLNLEIEYIDKNIFKVSNIVYVGVSNGAVIGALQGDKIESIRKMILINGPLMINFDRFVNGLQNCSNGRTICLVYGEKDPSQPYTCLFEKYQLPAARLLIEEGCDHNFTGKEDRLNQIILNELGSDEFNIFQ